MKTKSLKAQIGVIMECDYCQRELHKYSVGCRDTCDYKLFNWPRQLNTEVKIGNGKKKNRVTAIQQSRFRMR